MDRRNIHNLFHRRERIQSFAATHSFCPGTNPGTATKKASFFDTILVQSKYSLYSSSQSCYTGRADW